MDSQTILYIVLGLLVLFYIICTIFSAKTWRILYVMMSVLLFFSAAVFFVFAVATLKTHQQWREYYLEQQEQLAAVELDNELLVEGIAYDDAGELQLLEDSIRETTQELGHQLYDRGRVWRNCAPGTVSPDSVTLGVAVEETAPAGSDDAEGSTDANPAPHMLVDKQIVYAFKEMPQEDGTKLPSVYLGEFQVTGTTDSTVTLSPTLPLDSAQLAEVQNRNATWVLYEIMPVDSHEIFTELADTVPERKDALRQFMTPQRMNESGGAYEALLDEYARDLEQADPNKDPPGRIWKRITFVKPHKIVVDVEGEPQRFPQVYFDSLGRAVPISLQLGEPTEFDIGDVAILDQATADQLVAEGVAEAGEPVFVRELRDYEYYFHEAINRMRWLEDIAQVVQRDTQRLINSHTGSTTVVGYREGENTKLQSDLAKLNYERQQITNYLGALTRQWVELRADLSRLYNENILLAGEITRIQLGLKRLIDERTRRAIEEQAQPMAAVRSAGEDG